MFGPLRRNRRMAGAGLLTAALVCVAASATVALGDSHGRGATFAALSCGAQVTTSVTLTADIGPCPPSTDGIDIVASGIRVNLNGHSITGTNSTNNTTSEPVGIGLMNVHDVTLTGPGTVQNFDAGVSVNGGYGNTIKNLTAQNNVAHVLFSGGVDPTNLEATPCDYGDGVLTDNSNNNLIQNVTATGNGPFDGIALVDASNYNKVVGSKSYNN
ncbi:MAG TPA: right-handed parallel beta-helix repeat-containing protein, partial [Solirubrobacteraceae bacterium]|nr:right-handed parallel beta-helix repeat-containing protein [Solirubrobacteraceae bacterium]